jgi:hypothetical protein
MKSDKYSHEYGNLAYGWRTIKKGGIIVFDGRIYKDERIVNLVGERVEVTFDPSPRLDDDAIKVQLPYGGSIEIKYKPGLNL